MSKVFQSRQTFHTPMIGIRLNLIHYGIIKYCLEKGFANSNELKDFFSNPEHGFLIARNYKTRSGRTQLSHQYFGQCVFELQSAHFLLAEENRKPYIYSINPKFKEKLWELVYIIDKIEKISIEIDLEKMKKEGENNG